ncbi:MAG: bifunctional serine/threonine-protein kinase/formylglycine-generating enzyme family protein [Pirellulaceae bacterium]|nr:protein kinase [Planctomycetales bacterium]
MSRKINHPSLQDYFQRLTEIDSICDQFESLLRDGQPASLGEFLNSSSTANRDVLFVELLQIERDYRLRAGEAVTEQHYLERYPEFAGAIRHVFEDLISTARTTDFTNSDRLQQPAPNIDRIGRFRVSGLLGRGACGNVYQAVDPTLGRDVAIKVAHAGELDRKRLTREATNASMLSHPGIVPVFEVGDFDGGLYIVMEYVRGHTLAKVLRHVTQFGEHEAADIVCQLAKAVQYAHGKGVIHRDIKPSNILVEHPTNEHVSLDDLDSKSVVRITDFGLAQQYDSGDSTSLHGVVGTPGYMSPEQAAGKSQAADERSDIFSLGMVLFHLLTGRVAFEGELFDVICRTATQDAPDVRSLRADVSKDLAAICNRCTAREPTKRYASARELLDDIERWRRGEPTHARYESPMVRATRRFIASRRSRALALLSILALVAAFTTLHWQNSLREQLIETKINDYLRSDSSQLPEQLSIIHDSLPLLEPELTKRFDRATVGSRHGLLLVLSLLRTHPEYAERCVAELLRAAPDDFVALLGELADNSQIPNILSATCSDEAVSDRSRCIAYCALTHLRQHDTHLLSSREVLTWLMAEEIGALPHWSRTLVVCRDALLPDLRQHLATPATSAKAFVILRTLYANDTNTLLSLTPLLDGSQWKQLLPQYSTSADESRRALQALWQQAEIDGDTSDPAMLGKARLALAQIALGQWPENLFRYDENASMESYVVHLARKWLKPDCLTDRLLGSADPHTQFALLSALGTYPIQDLPDNARSSLVPWLVEQYRHHPDSGVHSAIRWLVDRWGLQNELADTEAELAAAGYNEKNNWYHNQIGQIMIVVRGPVAYLKGQLESGAILETVYEHGPISSAVPYSFAVSATEVRWRDVLQLPEVAYLTPDSVDRLERPIRNINVFTISDVCTAMDRLAGITDANAMQRVSDIVVCNYKATGYRLPTDDEWEYLCRAGSTTRNFFGTVDSPFLSEYAWNDGNAKEDRPGGQKMPNRLGLFDINGNVHEWTLTPVKTQQNEPAHVVQLGVNTTMFVRGGAWDTEPIYIRSHKRAPCLANAQRATLGFRWCHTIHDATHMSSAAK